MSAGTTCHALFCVIFLTAIEKSQKKDRKHSEEELKRNDDDGAAATLWTSTIMSAG